MSRRRERRPILVVFDTRHGHCAVIARRIEERIRARGHDAGVEHAPGGQPLSLDDYAAAIILAPVYNRRHLESIERFVLAHVPGLRTVPTAFISVSLGAAARLRFVRKGIAKIAERLFASARWRPDHVLYAGGRIDYPVYSPAMQRWMRTAAFVFGLPRDTTRRHELTRWEDIDDVVDAVLGDVERTETAAIDTFA